MIAIVSGTLSVLAVLAVIWLWNALRGMKQLQLRWIEGVETFFVFSALGAFVSIIVALALNVQAPPVAPWEHPLLWLQAVGALAIAVVAFFCSNAVKNTRERRRMQTRSPMEHYAS